MTPLTVEFPDPKFQKDDVVKWGQLILHVQRVRTKGEWTFYNGEHHLEWDEAFKYDVTVQDGEGLENNPIRPGTVMTFSEAHVSEFAPVEDDCEDCGIDDEVNWDFATAEKIPWDKPIVGPDTMDNLGERWNAWKVSNGVSA